MMPGPMHNPGIAAHQPTTAGGGKAPVRGGSRGLPGQGPGRARPRVGAAQRGPVAHADGEPAVLRVARLGEQMSGTIKHSTAVPGLPRDLARHLVEAGPRIRSGAGSENVAVLSRATNAAGTRRARPRVGAAQLWTEALYLCVPLNRGSVRAVPHAPTHAGGRARRGLAARARSERTARPDTMPRATHGEAKAGSIRSELPGDISPGVAP